MYVRKANIEYSSLVIQMKLMVTGGTGFVGSHIVDALEKTYPATNISLLVRDPSKAIERSEAGMKIYKGDITDPESLQQVITDFSPEVVIHVAALTDDWAPLSQLMEVNAQGTQNVIDAMSQSSSANFLIHISSSGVYPRKSSVRYSEDSPYGPFGNYHKSKVVAEQNIMAAIEKELITATIIRPPNIMGPRDFTHMVKICQAIKARKFPIINGGKARQTWVAAEDLAEAVLLVLQQRETASGQIYNVKSFEITVKELYNEIVAELNIAISPKAYPFFLAYSVGLISEIIGNVRGRPSTLNRYRVLKFAKDRLFDDSKIRSELGFEPQIPAKEAITRTVNWLKNKNII